MTEYSVHIEKTHGHIWIEQIQQVVMGAGKRSCYSHPAKPKAKLRHVIKNWTASLLTLTICQQT